MTRDEEAAIVASAVLIDAIVKIELMSDEAL